MAVVADIAREEVVRARKWIGEIGDIEVSDDGDIDAESILLINLRRDNRRLNHDLCRRCIDLGEQRLDRLQILGKVADNEHSLECPAVAAAIGR